MEFQSALEKRNLQTTNLPVAQQKKIADLLKLKEQVEEAEQDAADAEEHEQINEAKQQIAEVDQELAVFIENFDLEIYEKRKQSAAAIREKRLSKIKNKEQHQEEPKPEPKSEPKPEPQPEPKPQPQPEPVKQPEPPVYENETSIAQAIKEQEQEQEICEDCSERLDLAMKMQKQGFRPKQIWIETGYVFQEGEWHLDEDWEKEERRYEPLPVYNEFEKVAEVKKKPKNYSLWVIGIGALILTVGAVNLFKERK